MHFDCDRKWGWHLLTVCTPKKWILNIKNVSILVVLWVTNDCTRTEPIMCPKHQNSRSHEAVRWTWKCIIDWVPYFFISASCNFNRSIHDTLGAAGTDDQFECQQRWPLEGACSQCKASSVVFRSCCLHVFGGVVCVLHVFRTCRDLFHVPEPAITDSSDTY